MRFRRQQPTTLRAFNALYATHEFPCGDDDYYIATVRATDIAGKATCLSPHPEVGLTWHGNYIVGGKTITRYAEVPHVLLSLVGVHEDKARSMFFFGLELLCWPTDCVEMRHAMAQHETYQFICCAGERGYAVHAFDKVRNLSMVQEDP